MEDATSHPLPAADRCGPAITKLAPPARSLGTATRPFTITSMRFRRSAAGVTRGIGTHPGERLRVTPSGARRTHKAGLLDKIRGQISQHGAKFCSVRGGIHLRVHKRDLAVLVDDKCDA